MSTQRPPGLAAGTAVHTPEGLRAIESLVAGDVVLTPSGDERTVIPKGVTRVSGPIMRPALRVACREMDGEDRFRQLVIVAGDQPFHVTGAVDADPDFPPPQGWIKVGQIFYGQILGRAAGPGAHVSSVDPIWRSRTNGVGWIDLDRDSEAGTTIDMQSTPPVEAQMVLGARADFPGDASFIDRYSDEGIAEECAYQCAMYGLTLEDGAPFLVGEHGLVVASISP